MKNIKSKYLSLCLGITLLVAFVIWTILVLTVDVKAVGQDGTNIGFAKLNRWFHGLTGVTMWVYYLTDWLGLIPIFCCMLFGVVGLVQLIKRKSLLKIDKDILVLGGYYIVVILAYLIFEMIPVNYRPILIEGRREVSYPSSTTLLVIAVMPSVAFQVNKRLNNRALKGVLNSFIYAFLCFMVIGRALCGVHWLTDIIASILLGVGLYLIYFSCTKFLQGGGEKGGV